LAGQPPAVDLLDGLTTPEQLAEKWNTQTVKSS